MAFVTPVVEHWLEREIAQPSHQSCLPLRFLTCKGVSTLLAISRRIVAVMAVVA